MLSRSELKSGRCLERFTRHGLRLLRLDGRRTSNRRRATQPEVTLKISIAVALIAVPATILACSSRTEQAAPLPPVPAAVTMPSAAVTSEAPVAALIQVTDTSQVCMVNNQFMGRPQIPVAVGGKTYYGCCAMCKGKLEGDAKARTATDPVSGQSVDKATAIIGKNDSGAVLYFQSRENLLAYKP